MSAWTTFSIKGNELEAEEVVRVDKDYDLRFSYFVGKANFVDDALNRKLIGVGACTITSSEALIR